jgi:hypothetical protein
LEGRKELGTGASAGKTEGWIELVDLELQLSNIKAERPVESPNK